MLFGSLWSCFKSVRVFLFGLRCWKLMSSLLRCRAMSLSEWYDLLFLNVMAMLFCLC